MPADIVIRGVPRAADKTIVIIPSQGHRHVFWRKIRAAIAFSAADDDQRKDAEDTVPDRSAYIQAFQLSKLFLNQLLRAPFGVLAALRVKVDAIAASHSITEARTPLKPILSDGRPLSPRRSLALSQV